MRTRAGFTLMEVMVAIGILVVSLSILVQSQGAAALMTEEAERILIATQLAQEKLAEVQFLVENEGFQSEDVFEEGEFDDFGDEVVDAEFQALDQYHYEFLVTELDLEAMGDVMGNLQNMVGGAAGGASGGNSASITQAMSALPIAITPEMIGQVLDPFIREVKVRVWWGKDADEAEEEGDEVVITTHMIQPHANMLQGLPFMNGGAGGAGSNSVQGGRSNGAAGLPGGGRPGGGGAGLPGGGGSRPPGAGSNPGPRSGGGTFTPGAAGPRK
jgi:prepilin-type N-terminal cleavage/methylation domain-containing protein